MFAPGVVAIFFSVLVLIFMKDSPEKEGFPPIDEGKPKKKTVETPATGLAKSFSSYLPSWRHKVFRPMHLMRSEPLQVPVMF